MTRPSTQMKQYALNCSILRWLFKPYRSLKNFIISFNSFLWFRKKLNKVSSQFKMNYNKISWKHTYKNISGNSFFAWYIPGETFGWLVEDCWFISDSGVLIKIGNSLWNLNSHHSEGYYPPSFRVAVYCQRSKSSLIIPYFVKSGRQKVFLRT